VIDKATGVKPIGGLGVADELSVAGKLAALDAHEELKPSDPRIDGYDAALARLEEKCGTNRERFGDMAVTSPHRT